MKNILFIVCFCIFSGAAFGQYTFSGNATGTVTVSQVLSLTVTTLAGTVSFSGVSDYASGKTVTDYSTIAIKSNVPWVVSVSCPATFTAMGGGAGSNMPSSSVGVRLTGSGMAFYPLSSGLSLTGNPGNVSVSGNTLNIDMNFNPGYSHSGGSYSLTLLYTLTHQ